VFRDNVIPTEPPCGGSQLSLAMIVRDGGQKLASLLATARPWVAEIVVGDTGSRDGSPDVARDYGARVLTVPWTDDFAAARNAVLDACLGDWVLILDADETLAPGDWDAMRTWLDFADRQERAQAGRIVTRHYADQSASRRGWMPVPDPDPHGLPDGPPAAGYVTTAKVRLFPNLAGIRFRGRIRETVEASLWESHVAVVDLAWPVHDLGRLQPDRDKARYQLRLAHFKTNEQPHDAAAWAELAECALALDDRRQATVAIERSLALDPTAPDRHLTAGWVLFQDAEFGQADHHFTAIMDSPEVPPHLLAEAAHLRAQIALRQERPHDAAPLLAFAVRLFPTNGHYQHTLGTLNMRLGEAPAARRAFERAAALLPGEVAPLLNLAVLDREAGDPDGAERHLRAALDRDPDNAPAHDALSELVPLRT
jgi:tetratricopeptide (TPR) repeat protein